MAAFTVVDRDFTTHEHTHEHEHTRAHTHPRHPWFVGKHIVADPIKRQLMASVWGQSSAAVACADIPAIINNYHNHLN